MKWLSIVIIAGIILLYFVDSAFKLNTFDPEMLIHSGLRFFIGFLILGIGVFYAHKIRLKFAICLVLALALGDDIWDYTRHVNSFSFEVMLHSLYMMAWGALAGYVLMKRWFWMGLRGNVMERGLHISIRGLKFALILASL